MPWGVIPQMTLMTINSQWVHVRVRNSGLHINTSDIESRVPVTREQNIILIQFNNILWTSLKREGIQSGSSSLQREQKMDEGADESWLRMTLCVWTSSKDIRVSRANEKESPNIYIIFHSHQPEILNRFQRLSFFRLGNIIHETLSPFNGGCFEVFQKWIKHMICIHFRDIFNSNWSIGHDIYIRQ